ncbi:MAG: alpha-ketoacid dehydrogenase subunit beta [Dehalococcoidia bacterium]
MSEKNLIEAIREAIFEEMARDDTVFILGEDVGVRGGVFLATDGLLQEYGDERVIDTPLAESSIAGIAVGAALNGMRPIAEIQFADFIWPAVNQIVGEASKALYGSNGKLNVPLVVRAPSGGGIRGALYHSQSVEQLFTHTPGLKVVMPSTPYDAKGLLKSSIRDNDPVIFLEHKKTYRLVVGDVPDNDYTIPLGSADIKLQGSDITIVTYGLMVHHCLEAAETLSSEGISCEVIDLRTLKPIDTNTIIESVKRTSRVLVVHEDNKIGGIGGEIVSTIVETGFEFLDAPPRRLAAPDVPAMPYSPTLENLFMIDTEKIIDSVRKLVAF